MTDPAVFHQYLPHLIELRQRLLRCVIFYLVILIPLIIFSAKLYAVVAQPILQTLPQGGQLIATKVIAPFTTPLKLCFVISFMLSVPMILYHAWAFVSPGLYTREKKLFAPIVLLSILLFYIGILFAHCIVLPLALGFFLHIAPSGVTVMTDISHYLDFVLAFYLAFGAAFEVPILTFLLIKTGVISIETLQTRRPFIIVAAFVIGMLLTPPDVISQILLALPLLALFEIGLLLTKWHLRSTVD